MSINVAIINNPLQQGLNNFIHAITPISKNNLALQNSDVVHKNTYKDQEASSMITKQMLDSLNQANIDGIRISVISFEDLKNTAVMICNSPEVNGIGTANDHRLGTNEEHILCRTCSQSTMTCPGHIGAIILNRWFFHPQFAIVGIYVLQSVCGCCGHLKVNEKNLKRLGIMDLPFIARLKAIAELASKITRCTRNPKDQNGIIRPCSPNPTYYPSKMKDTYIVMCEYKAQKLFIEQDIGKINDIFDNIPKESLRIMGFDGKTHPRDFIMKGVVVSPPISRPYVVREGITSQDYITSAYCDIIRYNNIVGQKLKETGDNIESERRNAIRNLYFYISHMIDNSDGKYTRSRDEPIQSIVQRVKNKDGFIRSGAMGKRNDMTGRTVLNPYNNLKFGEMAYPAIMRTTHTTPITVCHFNLDIIRKMYDDGLIIHNKLGNGQKKGLSFKINDKNKCLYIPQVGDQVERIAMDGDETMFNRQPTLDKNSIMGYKAKYIEDYKCFGLKNQYTTPHNADFDGDEGNKHKIQTLDARAEVRYISNVTNCIMNSKSNKPTMGFVYNSTTSGYLISDSDTYIDPCYWDDAILFISDKKCMLSLSSRLSKWNVKPYSGPALFSCPFPEDFYYTSGDVKIREGILVSGTLTSKHLGPTANSIIHYIWKNYGQERTVLFFTEMQNILDWYIEHRGFGIGFSSCVPKDQTLIDEIIRHEIMSAQLKIDSLGKKRADMTDLEREIHEKKIINALNNVSSIGNRISSETIDEYNSLNVMSRSGAKGKETNTAQIMGALCQQYVEGIRPQQNLTMGTRCSPYAEPNSDEIEDHGFISESFMKGSRVMGFIYHMMASRIGVMDTALKTADIGHMHHRMVKVLEDLTIAYDGSIRNASNIIFAYSYFDGLNVGEIIPTYSESTGCILNFIDVKNVIGKLNLDCGYF